ncbi:glycosyltransferase family 2 protein [Pectinatus sottacetonis]|uniref:glycosyltransferase family 2 protein n=1 Tax=Pectinatus sottacetonis TaxID=1002795 RepID=UPI0018C4DEA8|nr:glycosyltransferase family 2 protein [Pectinatus sottacetonis]
MLLSACYIVRNEEKNLARSIISIKSIVDEIIIVDTGSTDSTVNIARQYTDKIFPYQWQDDFAAARNFALTKAAGSWILFPDADEYAVIRKNFNIRKKLEHTPNIDTYLLKIVNIDIDNNKYLDEFYALRLFKNNNVMYKGKIHEQLIKKSGQALKNELILQEDMSFFHTGYTLSKAKKKAQRNLRLLQSDIVTPAVLIELAEAYNGVDDAEKALFYANKAVQQGRLNITYASRPYRLLISLLQKKQADIKIIKKAIEIAMLDFPEMPDFCAEYGNIFYNTGNYLSAIKYMEKALKLKKSYKSIEPTLFDSDKETAAEQIICHSAAILKNVKTIKVSACIIVKNEERDIMRWYNSVAKCSDEQIVIDTGSIDNTISILKKLPVKLYHYQWNDDFAAAKNYAIDKAKGDWIIFIDADQYFSADCIEKVRSEIARADIAENHPSGLFIIEINIEESTSREISRSYSIRVFRNDPDLRYKGAIHEELQLNSNGKFTIVKNDLLKIYHTGYSDSYAQKKAARNLKILLSEKYNDGIMRWHYIADAYYGMENYEKAVECIEKYFSESKYYVINGASHIWNTYINAMLKAAYPQDKILSELKKAIDKFPELPDFYALTGIVLFNNGKEKLAEKYLIQALDINKKNIELTIKDSTSFSMYLPTAQNCLRQINCAKKEKCTKKLSESTNINNTMLERNLAEGNKEEAKTYMEEKILDDDIINKTVDNIQWLFVAILSQPVLDKKYLRFLPDAIARLVWQFFSDSPVLSDNDANTYETLWPMILKHASDNVIEKYTLLADKFSLVLQKKIITDLLKENKWKAAYHLLKCMKNAQFDAELLYNYACCFYYLDELDTAEKYFLQAGKTGYSKEIISSYLAWIKDRRNGKW